jgi:FKBP-type peptidyl-prolyl cis-trans isomerase FklB
MLALAVLAILITILLVLERSDAERRERREVQRNEAGLAFLAANKEKPGVVTLASGLQYKVLSAGSGTDHPLVSAPCECHYEGRTAANYPSGPVFDSSYARGQPSTFAPNQVIKGESAAVKHSGPATLR